MKRHRLLCVAWLLMVLTAAWPSQGYAAAPATTQIRMTDFGFDPPQFVGILRADNDVLLEMRLVARTGQ
jgi:hypothetical protein